MNDMGHKYQKPKAVKICVCITELNNNQLYECTTLNNGEQLKFNYENILNGTLHQKKIYPKSPEEKSGKSYKDYLGISSRQLIILFSQLLQE